MNRIANRLTYADAARIPRELIIAGAGNRFIQSSSEPFSRILNEPQVADGVCHMIGSSARTLLDCQSLPERVAELSEMALDQKSSRIINWAKQSLWGNPLHAEWPAFLLVTRKWVSRSWFQMNKGIITNRFVVNARQRKDFPETQKCKVRMTDEICIDVNIGHLDFVRPLRDGSKSSLWAFERCRTGIANSEFGQLPFRMKEFVLGLGNECYPDHFQGGLLPATTESVTLNSDGVPFFYGSGIHLHFQLIDPTLEFSTPMWTLDVDIREDGKQTDLIVWEQDFDTFTSNVCGAESAFANVL